ncbi:transmembrane adaptor Erv26-domain-containing protein [Fimicolochytrium jonesii]|uniref:transmembrane adaptor Erv26-domain-containing protein n=1 Tax=Fimicolochytrium jonesii TaxID=1396493 RepID=UPI0022FDED46|nr:transmembrane adaptor Erv26-domain-containing protein [Fimicolochytrium jonesii]KAI8817934.1 transmembrane adaptor Erv26-domain-containing protein [Fimicolochytrium jonesii]
MPIFLGLLTYLGALLGFGFVTLSLACGLYYLAELVEEYTVLTKKIIYYTTIVSLLKGPELVLLQWIYAPWLEVDALGENLAGLQQPDGDLPSTITFASHILLWLVDGLSFKRICFSLLCHAWYSQLLRNFPNIELASPAFLISCVLVISDHFIWFFYFTEHYHSFTEIATFFGLIVWLIPFMYFISLSANEYTLPNFDPSAPKQKKNTNLVKTLATYLGMVKTTGLGE